MKKYLSYTFSIISIIFPKLAAKIALRFFATPTRIPRPLSEMEAYEKAEKFFLTNKIAAFRWGNKNDPVVLLIHGWNGRGTQISAFYKKLVEKKFQVIALDGPGHGISPGKMTNPSHYAQFITDAQKELAPEGAHAIIAHSFGGGCAVLAASRGLKTKGLVLIASPAFYDKVVDYFARNFGLKNKAIDYFVKEVEAFAQIHPKELNIGNIGSKLNLPALIIHDQDDNAVHFSSAQAICNSWPLAKLIASQGLGHRRILKDPNIIGHVVEFINTL